MISAMTQPPPRRRKFEAKYGLGLEHKKINCTQIEGTSPDMIEAVAASSILPPRKSGLLLPISLSVRPKKSYAETPRPKIEATNHRSTLRYHRGVLSYAPRVINRWFVRNAQNYHRGVVSCGGCDFLCTGDVLCQLRYIMPRSSVTRRQSVTYALRAERRIVPTSSVVR